MEDKIKQLQEEIGAYQTELAKLKIELTAINVIAPQPKSNHPSDISAAFRCAAVDTAEKVPNVAGIRNAIAALTDNLNQKQQQLQELEKQYQKQLRIGRVEQARQKIREQIQRIDEISIQAELAFLDLKTLYKEVEPDVRLLSDNPPGSYAARLEQLVHFNFLQVPVLVEQNNCFVLSGRQVDLFKPEKDAQLKAQAEVAREAKLAMDAQIAASQQKKFAQEQQRERERIQEILSVKKAELSEAEVLRAKGAEQVARGVRLDLDRIYDFIASTNAEIKQLQDEMDAVEKIV